MEYYICNAVTWSFWPNIYNTIYTDFIPPEKGVKRRIAAD
jgi:hypothetical protein